MKIQISMEAFERQITQTKLIKLIKRQIAMITINEYKFI